MNGYEIVAANSALTSGMSESEAQEFWRARYAAQQQQWLAKRRAEERVIDRRGTPALEGLSDAQKTALQNGAERTRTAENGKDLRSIELFGRHIGVLTRQEVYFYHSGREARSSALPDTRVFRSPALREIPDGQDTVTWHTGGPTRLSVLLTDEEIQVWKSFQTWLREVFKGTPFHCAPLFGDEDIEMSFISFYEDEDLPRVDYVFQTDIGPLFLREHRGHWTLTIWPLFQVWSRVFGIL